MSALAFQLARPFPKVSRPMATIVAQPKEREVFGRVRYMSAGGLERKTKPEQYVEKVEGRIGASD